MGSNFCFIWIWEIILLILNIGIFILGGLKEKKREKINKGKGEKNEVKD